MKAITKMKLGKLELRDCGHGYHEIVSWFSHDLLGKRTMSCYTLAYWVRDGEGYDLRFVGGRPLEDSVNWERFGKLAKRGQKILDKKVENEDD